MFWNLCSIVVLALTNFVLKHQSNGESYIQQPRENSPATICNSYYSNKHGSETCIEIEIPFSQNNYAQKGTNGGRKNTSKTLNSCFLQVYENSSSVLPFLPLFFTFSVSLINSSECQSIHSALGLTVFYSSLFTALLGFLTISSQFLGLHFLQPVRLSSVPQFLIKCLHLFPLVFLHTFFSPLWWLSSTLFAQFASMLFSGLQLNQSLPPSSNSHLPLSCSYQALCYLLSTLRLIPLLLPLHLNLFLVEWWCIRENIMLLKYIALLGPLTPVKKNNSCFQVAIFEDFPIIKI